jgi:hypothetical protein
MLASLEIIDYEIQSAEEATQLDLDLNIRQFFSFNVKLPRGFLHF